MRHRLTSQGAIRIIKAQDHEKGEHNKQMPCSLPITDEAGVETRRQTFGS